MNDGNCAYVDVVRCDALLQCLQTTAVFLTHICTTAHVSDEAGSTKEAREYQKGCRVCVCVCVFCIFVFLEGIGYHVQSAYKITRHPPALHNPVFGNIEHHLVELRSHSNSAMRGFILELGLYFKINVLPD